MLAYHNDEKIKQKYLKRVVAHQKADEIAKGFYWEDGRGCAVGCTIHGNNHGAYEDELGIPRTIAYLEDRIFEGLPVDKAKEWPARFLKSISPGTNLTLVTARFMVWLMADVMQFIDAKYPKSREACETVGKLYQWIVDGGSVTDSEWRAAAEAAAYADADAAEAAAYAAVYAAEAAAEAAAYAASDADADAAYAAVYAAEAAEYAAKAAAAAAAKAAADAVADAAYAAVYAAEAAEYAAEAAAAAYAAVYAADAVAKAAAKAAAYAAVYAAEYAAEAAADAVAAAAAEYAAEAAAAAAAYERMADKLIELLESAPICKEKEQNP